MIKKTRSMHSKHDAFLVHELKMEGSKVLIADVASSWKKNYYPSMDKLKLKYIIVYLSLL
jgi:hypothetical protein